MINNNFLNLHQFQNQFAPKTGAGKPESKPKKLKIFYVNDPHGISEKLAGILGAAKIFKQKHQLDKDTASFVLSGGDLTSGANSSKSGFVLDLIKNIAGIDVSAVGNHEVDGGGKAFFEAVKDKHIDFVATNVDLADDNPMKNIVKKSIIKEQNGEKYGFIGAMPQDFLSCTKKAAQVGIEVDDFEDTIESLQEEINNLRQQGINKIILVSHSGFEMDKKLAQNLDGVDIIVGGHSHTLVEGAKDGKNVVKSKSGETVLIVQGGSDAEYYGICETEFNEKGQLTKIANKIFANTNKKKNPVIETIKSKQMGDSPAVGKLAEVDAMPKNRRIEPCAWTDFLADSMRAELKTDIAIVNAANTRKVPQEGVLTRRDIEESSPMKNTLIKTTITQKQLVEAVKVASKTSMTSPEGEPGLLHFSGVRYKIDTEGNLLEMSILDKQGNYTPININNPSDSITYSACYDDFVAKVGGEYPQLATENFESFNFDKDETLARHIASSENKENLVVTDDKRIEIIQAKPKMQAGSNNQKFLNLSSLRAS